MNYLTIKKLPTIEEIIQKNPLSDKGHKMIMNDRREIKSILEGKDPRLLIIIGPCSAWPNKAVFEYAQRLKKVSDQLKDSLKIVMRMYIQKPRTTKGWTGPLNQPDPFIEPDIETGIHYARNMMVKVVEMGLPIADECLFTHNARGFSELVAWFAIGARSSEDHEHRIFASAANCPVGMKNPTHGSLAVAINSVIAAQHSHHATLEGFAIKTCGNPYAHLVLRGSNEAPNYSLPFLDEVKNMPTFTQIKNPAILIDVSHDNCLMNGQKNYLAQPDIIFNIIHHLKKRPDLRRLIKGFMIESFLKDGHQKLENLNASSIDLNGLSITDPCLGWEKTEGMLFDLAKEVKL